MEHLSKRNVRHGYTDFVGQTRKKVSASELLVVGWFVFTQMVTEGAWSGQTDLCCTALDPDLHLADPDLRVALAYNYRHF